MRRLSFFQSIPPGTSYHTLRGTISNFLLQVGREDLRRPGVSAEPETGGPKPKQDNPNDGPLGELNIQCVSGIDVRGVC